MKLLYKVEPITVKRAFVVAQKIRYARGQNKRYLPKLTRKAFLRKLNRAKQAVFKLNEAQLDRIIEVEYKKRKIAYDEAEWYMAVATPRELGVWRRAGGLPPQWTCGSLLETTRYVKRSLEKNSKKIRARSKRAIPRIAEFVDIITQDSTLYPIVFQHNTGTRGRRWCKRKVKGDIDDGCMRAIALVLRGYKQLKIYYGKPKQKC